MAAPNIAGLTVITGKTDVLAVTASATAIVTNAAASGKVYKVNSLYVSNIGAGAKWVTVDFYRSSTATRIAYQVSVPVGTTLLPILKDSPLYLEEGDSLRLTAETVSFLEALVSYEILL
jgi:hypothetical protein